MAIFNRSNQALAVAGTAMLLLAFVGTATNIAIPVLEEEFSDAGLATISWVVSGFNVAQVTFMLLGGRLADRIGRKKVFLRGLTIFAIGAGLSAVAPNIELVIISRIGQAIGVALALPASLAAVLPEFPAERRASVVSLWSSMGVLGAAVAPTVAASILQVSSWRTVFLAAVPVALAALVAGRAVLTPGGAEEEAAPLDVVGAVTGTVAIGGLTLVIVQGRIWGMTDGRIVAIAVATLASAWLFIRTSRTHPEPLLDLNLLRVPTFTIATAATSMLSASTGATWFLYPLFMSEVWDYSVLQIGLAITPGPVALIIVAPVAGRLADRHGYRQLLIFGALVTTAGTAWMALRLGPNEPYLTTFFPSTLAIGIGMGCTIGPANAAALGFVPSAQLGAANALYNMSRMASGTIGVAVVAAIIGDTAVGERLDAFRIGWWSMTAIMALGPVLLIARYPSDRRTGPEASPTLPPAV